MPVRARGSGGQDSWWFHLHTNPFCDWRAGLLRALSASLPEKGFRYTTGRGFFFGTITS